MELVIPMLANEVPVAQLIDIIQNPMWQLEQKADGRRALIHVGDRSLTVRNRYGEPARLDLPPLVRRALLSGQGGDLWLDGEIVGEVFHVFDLPRAGGCVTEVQPLTFRRQVLENLVATWQPGPAVRLVDVAYDSDAKTQLVARVDAAGGEGVVAKKTGSTYQGGHSDDWLKVKFTRDVDCVVKEVGRDGKHNLVLELHGPDGPVEVGEVTALAGDGAVVKVGDVVTVKYQHASHTSGKLVQPTMPRIRTDKRPAECTIDQLVVSNRRVL